MADIVGKRFESATRRSWQGIEDELQAVAERCSGLQPCQCIDQRCDESGRWDRDDPRYNDPIGNAPADRRNLARCLDADDTAGDRVGSRNRNAQMRRGEQRDGATSF
jgi:hypothetical protein